MDILERAELIRQAELDPNVAMAARRMAENDICDFANTFGWIYEPRPGREHHVPLKLYPHETRMLKWLEERYKCKEDGLVEKSRDMGVTWMVAAVWGGYHWLFDPDFHLLIGSKKEDDVDNRLPDSIFGKIDYFISHLPDFLLPIGYNSNKHRSHMRIYNPENRNSLIGEATNPNFSRSGRYSAIFLDEFAFVDNSHLIWQSCGDSTDCRFPVSTPNGKGNKFCELANESTIQKITIHWREHPDKNEAWYESQKSRRTPDEIAQELDISYTKSRKGRIFGEEWDELVESGRLTELTYDPLLPVFTSWDFGISTTAIGFYQILPSGSVKLIDYYENSGYSIDHYIKYLQDMEKKMGYRYEAHYGDINANHTDLTSGTSAYRMLKDDGITLIGSKIKNKQDALNAAKLLLRKMFIDRRLTKFHDAISEYHHKWDDEKRVWSNEPVHDWSSHCADQLTYFALHYKTTVEQDIRPVRPRMRDPYATTTY